MSTAWKLIFISAFVYCYSHKEKEDCVHPRPNDPLPAGGISWINCSRPHELYSCGSACQNECNTLGQTCPIVNIRCNDDCYCCPGYARNCEGKCIPEDSCPPKGSCKRITWINCSKPHEFYTCGSACQNECNTLGETCPIINKRCNDACYCCSGYARDCKGNCIPEDCCPPKGSCKRHLQK